jgi:tellurite resistance protein TerC
VLYVALCGQLVLVLGAYRLETRARRRRPPSARDAIVWSGVWLGLGLLPSAIFAVFADPHSGTAYAAVYLIERALSLDNVFVFAVLIAAFEIPSESQDHMVSRGALAAFALRVPAILGGVAVFETSHVVGYVLGAGLILLAIQTARSDETGPGAPNRFVGMLQRRLSVSAHRGRGWVVVEDGRRKVTPMLMCLIAIVFADLAFAVDSIPAALAISHDAVLLLSANLLALLGLRALYRLVAIARERLRYMNETIAVLLLLAGCKLLLAGSLEVGPLASLAGVLVVLAAGTALSLRGGASLSRR